MNGIHVYSKVKDYIYIYICKVLHWIGVKEKLNGLPAWVKYQECYWKAKAWRN